MRKAPHGVALPLRSVWVLDVLKQADFLQYHRLRTLPLRPSAKFPHNFDHPPHRNMPRLALFSSIFGHLSLSFLGSRGQEEVVGREKWSGNLQYTESFVLAELKAKLE